MNAIDTNIWIYRHDTRDPQKQQIAQQLISGLCPVVLFWQVGCEFLAASRKLAVIGFTEQQAWAALTEMRHYGRRLCFLMSNCWTDARDLQARYALSFWMPSS